MEHQVYNIISIMKSIEEKAALYASQNFCVESGIPGIAIDISSHLKRAYIISAKESIAGQFGGNMDIATFSIMRL